MKSYPILIFCLISFLVAGIFCNSTCAEAEQSVKFVAEVKDGLTRPVDAAVSSNMEIFVLDEEAGISVFDKDFTLLRSFDKLEEDFFLKPQSIAITPHQRVLVADTNHHQIKVFDRWGIFQFAFGSEGVAVGQFRYPVGIAADHFGFIFVADRGNRRVQIFSPNGIYFDSFPVEGEPVDVSVDLERNIYVLLTDLAKVVRYDSSYERQSEIIFDKEDKSYAYKALGLAVDNRGNIYVTEQLTHSVLKYNPQGQKIISFGSQGSGVGQFKYAKGLCVGQEEHVYVADTRNGRLQGFKITGEDQPELFPDETSPLQLDFDSIISAEEGLVGLSSLSGLGLFMLSESNNQIRVINRSDRVIGQTGLRPAEFRHPKAFYVTLSGHIFVADTKNNRVQIFDKEGNLIYHFGREGNKAGQFNLPSGIAVDSKGNIYVADTLNHRIQVFTFDGIFFKEFGHGIAAKSDDPYFLNTPGALAIDLLDRLYVLDRVESRIKIFDSSGSYITSLGERGAGIGQFENPVNLFVDKNGFLYVVDQGNFRIQIFNENREFVLAFGSPGKGRGYFQKLSAVSAAEDKVYVADYRSSDIQVFRYMKTQATQPKHFYATKAVYPIEDEELNPVARFAMAEKLAAHEALKELLLDREIDLSSAIQKLKFISVEILNDGRVKVTLSLPQDVFDKVQEE